MQRRVALKSLAVVVAGIVFLPGCDLSYKSSGEVVQFYLSPSQDQLLSSIVETFIPATDTPGAKELRVQDYVKIMVTDCHEPEVQKIFFEGLDMVGVLAKEKFGKEYSSLSISRQSDILKTMESGTQTDKDFYTLLKGLTIQGYMSSEYVMKEHRGYQMIPGYFHGCVPVKRKA